uniref:Uncharacterized protein n=1 Tax=Solanum tuberosum TaxID=4113 RepID=M1DWA9_SOLTU
MRRLQDLRMGFIFQDPSECNGSVVREFYANWKNLMVVLILQAGVPEESVDYMAPLFTTPLDVTKTKGTEYLHRPTLTTAECNKRDDLITTHMFGQEMLCHRNGHRASTQEQLDEIATSCEALVVVVVKAAIPLDGSVVELSYT